MTACNLVVESGADYVKQSTGTTPNSSFCLGDTRLLKNVAGDKIRIKSSGWIMNVEDAIGSIEFGASRVGNSLGPQWLDEFDKSSSGAGSEFPFHTGGDRPMDSEGKLAGKKAIVTGSGTGIGREVALEFARQGADVVLHYAHAAAGAESAAEEIRSMGRRAAVFPADFDRIDEVLRLADQAIAFLGRVDCLVNNAGITFNRPFFAVTPEQFDRLYHVNVRRNSSFCSVCRPTCSNTGAAASAI